MVRRPFAVEGDRAQWRSARAATRTRTARCATLYYNNWTLRFDDDGRCVDFVEYFMQLPERLDAESLIRRGVTDVAVRHHDAR